MKLKLVVAVLILAALAGSGSAPAQVQPSFVHVWYRDLVVGARGESFVGTVGVLSQPIAYRRLGPYALGTAFSVAHSIAVQGLTEGYVITPPGQVLKITISHTENP